MPDSNLHRNFALRDHLGDPTDPHRPCLPHATLSAAPCLQASPKQRLPAFTSRVQLIPNKRYRAGARECIEPRNSVLSCLDLWLACPAAVFAFFFLVATSHRPLATCTFKAPSTPRSLDLWQPWTYLLALNPHGHFYAIF